ncbi:prepilin-type N-terminal cleavage/methylation domain-containing protein [Pseudothermotoga thermarum]|uniref:General secretion pathway protein G n=1 Tax=Pseudothermotoga thermarum DSM 5069 TaxID=688269 RepID=F7YUL5_9THEM|nr:prepilin-type N-terminal cleavage/methylation domain-containing protein [Pseudothermotoga thermarum]AEH51488.1 general secretion pathway protein G [Pseudothermotoga thermarum DSM 5069]
MLKGMTLIELLIVLVIIAALLVIAISMPFNAIRQATATKIAAEMRNIAVAAQDLIVAI